MLSTTLARNSFSSTAAIGFATVGDRMGRAGFEPATDGL
jgi:hypothetical protein